MIDIELQRTRSAMAESVTLPIATWLEVLDELESLRQVEPATQEPVAWIAVSDMLPIESDGEVLVRMSDGRCEIAWATYWHGASNDFAQWTFRDPDEDETPTHWMKIPK